jgi:tricorn protease
MTAPPAPLVRGSRANRCRTPRRTALLASPPDLPLAPLAPRTLLALLALPFALASTARPAGGQAAPTNGARARPALAEPALSPDGREIAFVSSGDIWTVPARGGTAQLLVAHPAAESRPLYSPDGRQLAFVSTRTGNGDIYVLTLATGELRRLTFSDGLDQLDAWSRDGQWIYFSTTSQDISGMNDILKVRADGGTPIPVSADRYTNEYWAAPSPDGTAIAFTARGIVSAQWWRNGHSHIDESEIWLLHLRPGRRYEPLTTGGAKSAWPMWSADGRTLYYVSDRSGTENLWRHPLGGKPEPLTTFRDGRVLWPTISADGRTIAFERDFGVWTLDLASGRSSEVPIVLRGLAAGPGLEHLRLTDGFRDLALSPDGRKIAFVAHGDATPITRTPADERQPVWSPDSRRLAYISDRDGVTHLFLYDLGSQREQRLTSDTAGDVTPRWSPDGEMIAFLRGGRELRVLDLRTGSERRLATAALDRAPFLSPRPFDWSPDGRWIAYLAPSAGQFDNAYVVPVSGGESRPVSFVPSVFGGSIVWSRDGTALFFTTAQRTEMGRIARVDLVPRTPHFREDRFRDLFREESPRPPAPQPPPGTPDSTATPLQDSTTADSVRANAPAAPRERPAPRSTRSRVETRIVFDDIRTRLTLLPVGLDVDAVTTSPDGRWALITASAAGQQNLYLYSLDDLDDDPPVPQPLTATRGRKADPWFAPDGRSVYYLEDGHVAVVSLATHLSRRLALTAELDVACDQEKVEVFHQAWRYLNDNFFDSTFNGADWRALRGRYEPYIAGARTPDAVRRLLSLMIGELNASHLGINPPGRPEAITGRLGLGFDPEIYERTGRLRITEVLPLSPAALAGGIRPGEYLLAVNGTTVDAHTNLDALLEHTVGRRVQLTVAASPDGAARREVAVRPVNTTTEKGLRYRDWVERNRAYVARASNGRLGYVHLPDMSAASLDQLYFDLDVENRGREGVVIDIRNNNGGFVNAYALDVFARRPYLLMTSRGRAPVPARSQLGQRALERPTILITNQHSLSDAEDFTQGYRALGLGKVVGEPTAGWIIYTSNMPLIDGSTVRLPTTRVTTADGAPMEMHPRPVDIPVDRPIGSSETGRDPQLDAAVRELLRELDRPRPAVGNGSRP